jgi:hypothetical protein
MKRFHIVSAAVVAALALAAPASAQLAGRTDWTYADEARQPYNESRRIAYDNGYREGVKEGEREGRRRDAFNYQDEGTWRNANKGYHRSFGDPQRYEASFRTGYAAGYTEAYRRQAPYGGYDNGPGGVYQNRGYGYPSAGYPSAGYPSGGYPNSGYPNGGYPNAGYGSPNGRYGYPGGGYYGPAYGNGVNDGYEKGREDARDRDAYDPLRHKWYREGDRNYKNEYGSRQQYENVYREGFKEGYDRGYREAAYRR